MDMKSLNEVQRFRVLLSGVAKDNFDMIGQCPAMGIDDLGRHEGRGSSSGEVDDMLKAVILDPVGALHMTGPAASGISAGGSSRPR